MPKWDRFVPPDQPFSYTNGHNGSAGNGKLAQEPRTFPENGNADFHRYSLRDGDRETTRYLSAKTLIDVEYASNVVHSIVHEPYRALAPAYGADVTVVARWAIDSLRRRMRRDVSLTVIIFAGVALYWALYILWSSIWWIPVGVLVTLAIAFAIVAREHWVRWHEILAGQMLHGNFDPAAAPAPEDPNARQRLLAVAQRRDGNVVVFRHRAAFRGSGRSLGREQMVIDVSQGKSETDGTVKIPQPFTNSEIHGAFIDAIADIKLRDMCIKERMFINGRHVQGHLDLQRDPLEPPYSLVSDGALRRATEHPAADARVYVCAEVHGWQGQQVVTLFARAVHTGGLLYIEWSFYVLPPIERRLMAEVDRLHEKSAVEMLRVTLFKCLYTAPFELLRSPFAVLKMMSRTVRWKALEVTQARHIRSGQIFDYGALPSIREDASQKSGSAHFFLERDAIMYVLLMQKSLLREIGNFLDRHDIALVEFEEQAKIIVDASYKNYNVHLGEVSNASIAIGESAQSGAATRTN
jgi:hypothetical protein